MRSRSLSCPPGCTGGNREAYGVEKCFSGAASRSCSSCPAVRQPSQPAKIQVQIHRHPLHLLKNPHIERLIQSAKLAHRNDRRFYVSADGIRTRHAYGDPPELTFWDEGEFVLNDYRVLVHLVHPRYAYQRRAEDLAWEAMHELDPSIDPLIFPSEPIYPKAAATRRRGKKIVGYRPPLLPQAHRDYFAAQRMKRDEILATSEATITPVWTTGWWLWCRFVDITVPLEVGREEDLLPVVRLVRRLLRGETTLNAEFPGYRYGREQWLQVKPDPALNLWSQTHAVA